MKLFITKLFTPSAFKLGLIITFIFLWMGFQFYVDTHSSSWVLQRLTEMHQKSIDIRLNDRGPRPGSTDVAIIAVDELSEEKIGRWPWPRGKIAEIIDLLVSYGAKVVAFDAVFVEPDKNQATLSLSKIKESKLVNSELNELIDQELSKANTDWVLARTVEKQSSHLVMGSYYDEPSDSYYPYQEFCGNLLAEKTPQYAHLEKEEKPVIAVDQDTFAIPEAFKAFLQQRFTDIETHVTKQWAEENKNPEELPQAIGKAQTAYCDRWLISTGEHKDEMYEQLALSWPQLRTGIEGWAELNFDEAVHRIKTSSLNNTVHRTGRWWTNLSVINEGAKHTAYFNATLDGDGTVRRSGVLVRYGGLFMSSLALKSVLLAKDLNAMITLEQDPTDPASKIVSKLALIDSEGTEVQTLPVDGQGRLLINYAGSDHMFPHMSIYELFNKRDDANISIRQGDKVIQQVVKKADFLKNKILIFGATSTGTYDLRVTPFSENYPGVETHANLIDNMLRSDFLVNHHSEGPKMLMALAIMGLILSFALSHLGAVQGLLVTAGTVGAIYFVDRFYLFKAGIIVAVILPLMMVFTMYVMLTFYKYLTEERKKKAMRGTFEKYVSPAIVAEVLKHPDNINLGGKKQRMTVIFSDLRGFTTISEKLDPRVLSDVLNKYLTPMTALVFKNDGTLDKYMGDAIMAFFGAPIPYPDHAKKACQCAIDMIDLLPKLNQEFKAMGLPTIDVGIGLNTGEMSVGNMGSETVRSYTVMGDAVNLGSRLESINKQYGTRIIISEFTYEEVKNDFIAREVDWVRVKGKMQPVKIYELIAPKSKECKALPMLEEFEKGFKQYHEKNWDEAHVHFANALKINPDDNPSKLYLERTTEYKESPPPPDWDGVYEMKTK
ncbi:MAG: CHASE2 domain-containing protein [Bdellovibrionales bacterium]